MRLCDYRINKYAILVDDRDEQYFSIDVHSTTRNTTLINKQQNYAEIEYLCDYPTGA